MNDVTTLIKAIRQAEDRGFSGLAEGWDVDVWKYAGLDGHSKPFIKELTGDGEYRTIPWQVILFNHDFAKALWGEAESEGIIWDEPGKPGKPFGRKGWKRHLKEMVIADDAIKYLEQNI